MLPHADIDLNWKRSLTEWCRRLVGLFPFQISQPTSMSKQSWNAPVTVTMGQRVRSPGFWIEVCLIFGVLWLYAGQLTPSVNETHYLTKAKHFWNPSWCPNDLFLGSSYSHYLFYLTTGWLTLLFSLDAYAWIGRILCWAGFAVGWYLLVQVFSSRPGRALIGIVIFLVLMDRFHMAGEWAIGGFEAKSISYVFALFALEKYFRGKWNSFWPWIGCACGFHVLVGGWILIGLVTGSLLAALRRHWGQSASTGDETIMKFPGVPMVCFLLLFALGALPPIIQQAQASPAINQMAFQIYVHERLPHHLLFGGFATSQVGRFALLCLIWFCFAWFLRKIPQVRLLNWFCTASLLITLAGLLLSGLAEAGKAEQGELSDWATGWLRFYWFRLSDFSIPLGISIMCVTVLPALPGRESDRVHRAGQLVSIASLLMILLVGLWIFVAKWDDPRSAADRASLPTYEDDRKRTVETQVNWQKACDWIRQNTPANAVFITPNDQQTFKWFAQRSEVVNWKDIPQNGEATLEWKRRIDSIYRIQRLYASGLLSFENPEQLGSLFGADYLLIEQSAVDALPSPTGLKQVYPVDPQRKSTYVVFQLQ